jgi:NlpC/P60 family
MALVPLGSGTSSPSSAAGAQSGSSIASDALKYTGHCYSFGGAPGASGVGCWDCSSFINFVIGHDLAMAIPGYSPGKYSGASHGPPTSAWLAWSGCTTVGHNASEADVGDLLIWQTHMGVCTGNGMMVSALNSNLGTLQTTISDAAPFGELLFVRRLKGVTPGSSAGLNGSSPSAGTNQGSAFGNWLLQSLGFPSGDLSDLLERGSLILLGAGLLIIGTWMLAGKDVEKAAGETIELGSLATGEIEAAPAGEALKQHAEKGSDNQ